jgi:simple sugar transport system permease protein
MGGLGGAYITLGQLGYFQEDIISGKGYIALVAVILGRRNPILILLSAMLIGFAESLQFTLQAKGVALPTQAFSMFPYLVAVLVLLFSIGKNVDPATLGIPYERDKR